MSGPKTSRYTLTAEQRKILAAQRENEYRKAAASESIRRARSRLLQIDGMFDNDKLVAAELLSRTGNDNDFSTAITNLETSLMSVRRYFPSEDDEFSDASSAEQTASEITSCLIDIEKIVESIFLIAARNQIDLKSCLQDSIDIGFTVSFADMEKADTNAGENTPNRSSLYTETVSTLLRLKKAPFLPQACLEKIDNAISHLNSIQDEDFLRNYIALTAVPLIKQIKEEISESNKYRREFESLISEYTALCRLNNYVPQDFICSESAVQNLRDEIARIKNLNEKDDEQTYISACLDEIMNDMGYSVLGSREVFKRNGTHFRNELYQYEEGTAVNITYSYDGKISIELGGIDTVDRMPTGSEAENLSNSMERFCEDFQKIEKSLLEKGIVPSERLSLLPPAPEYAQIINTIDYLLQTNVANTQNRKQHKTSGSLRATIQKEQSE